MRWEFEEILDKVLTLIRTYTLVAGSDCARKQAASGVYCMSRKGHI